MGRGGARRLPLRRRKGRVTESDLFPPALTFNGALEPFRSKLTSATAETSYS